MDAFAYVYASFFLLVLGPTTDTLTSSLGTSPLALRLLSQLKLSLFGSPICPSLFSLLSRLFSLLSRLVVPGCMSNCIGKHKPGCYLVRLVPVALVCSIGSRSFILRVKKRRRHRSISLKGWWRAWLTEGHWPQPIYIRETHSHSFFLYWLPGTNKPSQSVRGGQASKRKGREAAS